ncbi:MAG: biotin--[acetyl-CoA-carboxylase] ligase [Lachnospiraceae bacterium]|nr:biotin--[acetyl-CoA-carboxylase] ligase [Lachnospiraceae bacterium]
MNKETIEGQLATAWAARNLVYEPVTDGSTNDLVKALAEQGAPHGTLVVTEEQREGRGRNARVWLCPPGVNIAMSLLLRPRLALADAPLLTLIAGLSVAEGIEALISEARTSAAGDFAVGIKWPNDVVIDGKKICGILTESALTPEGRLKYCVIGIGINVHQTTFAEEVREIAGSVLSVTGIRVSRSALIEKVCAAFERHFAALEEAGSLAPVREAYEKRLLNKDRPVRVLDPRGEYAGTALGIDERGALLVRTADGEVCAVNAGEVSVRGLYHYAD